MTLIKPTPDGSSTLFSPQFNQHYHSVHGARQESDRVFLELGLQEAFRRFDGSINLLEMGFGTGLNAWLTAQTAATAARRVNYTGLEAYPISAQAAIELRQAMAFLNQEFDTLHQTEWGIRHGLTNWFSYQKEPIFLADYTPPPHTFHLIYYDAFAPEAQPELWTHAVFEKLYNCLVPEGILTTYCSKSYVQRNLKAAGFTVEKHPGPPHKREVLRAVKTFH